MTRGSMPRTSSFFWASDDLFDEEHNDDGCGDSNLGLSLDRSDHATSLASVVEGNEDGSQADDIPVDIHVSSPPRGEDDERAGLVENGGRGHRQYYYGAVPPAELPVLTRSFSLPRSRPIRFQVIIWHIGNVDVQLCTVKMKFRLTIFWNDDKKRNCKHSVDKERVQWVMDGRQRAYARSTEKGRQTAQPEDDEPDAVIDVPPVSILNAIELGDADAAEIDMIDPRTRLMRWTCMYSAILFQPQMSVRDFPHDSHDILLKVGVLAHRCMGGRWDRSLHPLKLADERDSHGSTAIPHGLIVEHCHMPDFAFKSSDLRFDFIPLAYCGRTMPLSKRDEYLQVCLPVHRKSYYFDSSVMPLLAVLNIIAITCLIRNFTSATAAVEILLSIAFVQVGIRLTLDSRLPSVGYQIKMQRVMNCCFWLLSWLVLESNLAFFLVVKMGWEIETTDKIDFLAAVAGFGYNVYIIRMYFSGKKYMNDKLTEPSGFIP